MDKVLEFLLGDEDDVALLAFLDYIDKQMTANSQLIVEADYEQLDRITKLVEGTELCDDDLPVTTDSTTT